jgi:uncharacterized Ntn-hydrolase superfamily protein
MTVSIVARDPEIGDVGIAIASKALAVGAIAPFARADVGAISSQAMPDVSYGPTALERMAAGEEPDAIMRGRAQEGDQPAAARFRRDADDVACTGRGGHRGRGPSFVDTRLARELRGGSIPGPGRAGSIWLRTRVT